MVLKIQGDKSASRLPGNFMTHGFLQASAFPESELSLATISRFSIDTQSSLLGHRRRGQYEMSLFTEGISRISKIC